MRVRDGAGGRLSIGLLDDFASKIVGPLAKMVRGDMVDGVTDAWRHLTPAGIFYDQVDTISERHVHLANMTGDSVAVIVAPNKDWVVADIAAAVALLLISMGSNAPAGLEALKNAKTLKDIYQATRIMRGVASVASKAYKLFAENGLEIANGTFADVKKRSNSNPMNYLDPSQWGAIAGASDFTVMLYCRDGRSALFNTNSDTSWIAAPPGYRKAKYGRIWVPDGDVRAW